MEVSQAAIDEVRAVRLAQEAMQRHEKLIRLTRMVDCCASCNYWSKGWIPSILCVRHKIGAKSYMICDDYKRRIT